MNFHENFKISGGKLPTGEITYDADLYLNMWQALCDDVVGFFHTQNLTIGLHGFDPHISFILNGGGHNMPVEIALAIQKSLKGDI